MSSSRGNHRGHHGRQALDIGVVAKARLDARIACCAGAAALAGLYQQPVLVHALNVALDGFRALRHGAVEPGTDLHVLAPQHIAGKASGDFDGQRQFAAAHAPVEILVVDDRRVLGEVARAGQVQRVALAERGLVAIEHRIAQVLDVHGDAEADHEHQEQRTAQRQRGAHRVALQFQRLRATDS
jgi:hypothetical protein